MAEIGTDIQKASELLKKGELVSIPTETVYGLGGNALDTKAILKIYEVKSRPKFDPLIAHTNTIERVEELVTQVPEKAKTLAEAFWPGPLTMLFDKKTSVPDLLTSGLDRVAVRIPDHPITLKLLEQLPFPLAAPSANPFGYVSPTKARHVNDQLGDKIAYILDGGDCRVGIESTIVGFENEEVVVHRLGGTELEAIKEVVGPVRKAIIQSSNPVAPGMLKSHYSPGKPMILGDIEANLLKFNPSEVGVISFTKTFNIPSENLFRLSEHGDLKEAAGNLFRALRELDRPEIRVILAEKVPAKGLGLAINDRLERAAYSPDA